MKRTRRKYLSWVAGKNKIRPHPLIPSPSEGEGAISTHEMWLSPACALRWRESQEGEGDAGEVRSLILVLLDHVPGSEKNAEIQT